MDIKMTADELLEFYGEYFSDGITFKAIFGEEYDFKSLTEQFSSKEIAMRIQDWKDAHQTK